MTDPTRCPDCGARAGEPCELDCRRAVPCDLCGGTTTDHRRYSAHQRCPADPNYDGPGDGFYERDTAPNGPTRHDSGRWV